jgi:hypothetical protein
MILKRGNQSTRRRTCPSTTLFTRNLIWTDPGSNTDLRGQIPAANRSDTARTLRTVKVKQSLYRLGQALRVPGS